MKFFSYILTILCLLPLTASGQSYKSLWKQVEEASQKDLPKTEMEKLGLIIKKASREKAYEHLLKASLRNTQVICSLTPDSIHGEVARLEGMEQEARAKDPVLAAVWNTVLGCVYRDNYQLRGRDKSKAYFKEALSQPALLAKHKVSEYQQLITNGYDGRWFDNDLLSVIGYEAKEYALLHGYYLKTPLRTAACLTACEMVRAGQSLDGKYLLSSERLRLVDSLLTVYGDIKVAGELAVYRYSLMERSSSFELEDKVNYINYAVSKWGGWPRINILRNALKSMTQPYIYANFGNKWNLPSQSRMVTNMSVRNVQEVTMKVTRLSLDASRDYDLNDEKDLAIVTAAMMPLNQIQQKRRYIGQPEYKTLTDSIEIPALPVGMYLVEFSSDNKNIPVQRGLYYVSDLHVISQGLPKYTTRYAVVSATTGQPVPGANLRVVVYDPRKKEGEHYITLELKCDENGETQYVAENSSQRIENVFPYTETDKYCPEESLFGYFRYYDSERGHDVRNVYTDRSVYRPGQKVHVAVIAYHHDGKLSTKSIDNETIRVTLRDANRKEVETKEVVTDAFGKASVEFDLPEAGLTGVFTVSVPGANRTFRVEQYKRPTYEVTFPEIHETYQAGDTVVVKGRAMTYSGVPVQNAKVEYTVSRESAWWWGHSHGGGTVLLKDNVTTDSEGFFSVVMPMMLPDGASSSYMFYNITAVAEVTDNGGESHSAEISLPLGSRRTVLACNLPKRMERDSLKTIRFDYKNMAGADVDALVTYYLDNSPKTYTARTNKVVPVGFDPNTLGSGKHLLRAICGEDTLKCEFVMFSLDDKTPCEKTSDWFYASGSEFSSDGRPVYVQVGSSDPDTHVLYTIVSGDNVLESGSFELDNSILCRPFTYQESYGNGILLTYAWVKGGKTYTHELTLRRPMPDRNLNLEWTTFRDRLMPGQKEQWILKVTKPDGTPAAAQVMATMYDKSLDQVYGHDWHFSTSFHLPTPTTRWNTISHDSFFMSAAEPYKTLNVPDLLLNRFRKDLCSMDSYYIEMYDMKGGLRMRNARFTTSMAQEEVARPMMADADEMVADMAEDSMEKNTAAAPAEKSEKVSVRENLNETAFFQPALVADAKGNVVIRFTLPESVTTWKVLALATDTDMNYGRITGETVAQKNVMVQPNVPRFLRVNDMATLSARIFNNTEKAVTGKATLALLDPETQKTVYTQTKDYKLEANQGSSVTFDVKADGKTPIYVCRVTVSGKGYSDGEQHYLPVLPDHEMVLRTYPFTQHGPGRVAVKLDKLFAEGIQDGKLTVEYTNNPVWLVLQTMPSLANPTSEDVISQSAAYYANSIGRYILGLSPAIHENIKAWQQELGSETSLNSPLQKNQELKDLVLSETPWVGIAEKESAQKRDLALYFNESLLDIRLQSSLYKIRQLQNSDGSWSWWPGMKGSAYMTMAVTQNLVRLNHMIGKQQNTSPMVASAFDFLGKYLVEEMKNTKKWVKENKDKNVRPSETALQIMYTFALDGREQPSAVKDAQKYFINLLSDKATQFTIYGKATAAVIFAANKQKQLADEFVESISQYSVMTEEAGRYFDTPRAYYSWCDYKIPTQVAAIEAYKSVRPDDAQTVEEMRRWLLHEKRGHMWNTSINSVNAAYAFLDGNLKALDNGESTRFTLNGKSIPVDGGTAGLGYVKTTLPANGTQAFAAEKTSEGTSWGALYAQFDQKSTEVTAFASELSVQREVVGSLEGLKVGDRIKVRITLKAERDLDFVQVVDRRAACMEPINQLSGYRRGCYCAPQDNQTCYYFDLMPKGTHVIETEYYIDRAGTYDTGTCKAQCAYAPEYVGMAPAFTLVVR